MSYLGYCILRAAAPWRGRLPPGIEGATISLVREDKLAVAVSRASDNSSAPDASLAAAYADVIAAFSVDRTVLPLRYGCFLPSKTHIHEFLRTRRVEFATLLDKLDGCVEMGVRVLLSRPQDVTRARHRPMPNLGSGTAYLTTRGAAYARQDANGKVGTAAAAAVRRTFEALSVQSREVLAVVGENLLVSLFFLIRREHVEVFHRRFRRFQEQIAYKLLLSGPWAPYNFVTPQEPKGIR